MGASDITETVVKNCKAYLSLAGKVKAYEQIRQSKRRFRLIQAPFFALQFVLCLAMGLGAFYWSLHETQYLVLFSVVWTLAIAVVAFAVWYRARRHYGRLPEELEAGLSRDGKGWDDSRYGDAKRKLADGKFLLAKQFGRLCDSLDYEAYRHVIYWIDNRLLAANEAMNERRAASDAPKLSVPKIVLAIVLGAAGVAAAFAIPLSSVGGALGSGASESPVFVGLLGATAGLLYWLGFDIAVNYKIDCAIWDYNCDLKFEWVMSACEALLDMLEKRRDETICNKSPEIQRGIRANRDYGKLVEVYPELKRAITLYKECDSKGEFDRFNPKRYIEGLLADENEYSEIYQWNQYIQDLRDIFDGYHAEFRPIAASVFADETWANREANLYASLPSVKELDINRMIHRIVVSYVSPKGRNSYGQDYSFSTAVIFEADAALKSKSTRQAAIAHERALMTSGLRFKVMQRDNFACVLCGSKASDGVKLEIDHIFPVSKGGKTTMDNLQTLCDRCNRGKSNKVLE